MAASLALVQGASRGIGLQFCRYLLSRPNSKVIATCRNPQNALELKDLQNNFPNNVSVYPLDVQNEDQIKTISEMVKKDHGDKLDLLINCAGILHPSGKGETSLRDVSSSNLMTTLMTNSIGSLLMAKHFGTLLTRGGGLFGYQGEPKAGHRGVLVNMSARVGSIGGNELGGWYSYRMSKAALNMATKTLSIELGRGRNKVVCISVHPGTVNTDLSRRYHRNVDPAKIFSPDYAVECIMGIIDGLTVEDSGNFFAWDGQQIPW